MWQAVVSTMQMFSCVLRYGMPPNIVNLYQEMGRTARCPIVGPAADNYVLLLSLDHYNFLLKQSCYQFMAKGNGVVTELQKQQK
jgi:hypothetical protein